MSDREEMEERGHVAARLSTQAGHRFPLLARDVKKEGKEVEEWV